MSDTKLESLVFGKKILFIGPRYFDYSNEIKRVLEDKGAKVDYIVENIDSTSYFWLFVSKLPRKLSDSLITMHFDNELKKCKNDYDYIFCLRVGLFNEIIIKHVLDKSPEAKTRLLYWDSCKNMRYADDLGKYFEKVFSFDPDDCKRHEKDGWIFRPDFFMQSMEKISEGDGKKYDVIYIASLSRERARAYHRLKAYCDEHNMTLYARFFCKKLIFDIQKRKTKEYQDIEPGVVIHKGLSFEEIVEKMSDTRCMYDFCHTSQSGATMRTIECVGAKLKMASSNQTLKDYDFYDEHNFYIVPDDMDGLYEFVKEVKYQDLPEDIYEKYSLEYWLAEVLA